MDILKALHQRASVLENELGKVQEAIRAMTGILSPKTGRTGKPKYRHSEATKRKLRLAQQKI